MRYWASSDAFRPLISQITTANTGVLSRSLRLPRISLRSCWILRQRQKKHSAARRKIAKDGGALFIKSEEESCPLPFALTSHNDAKSKGHSHKEGEEDESVAAAEGSGLRKEGGIGRTLT